MKSPSRNRPAIKLDQIAPHGRDELNIAEFPIARLSSDENETLKSLSFSDSFIDRNTGKPLTRSVTVEGSATLGLPRPFDMDVLLCLIQLTKATNNFTDRVVHFHRGELLELMRMTDAGDNYERLTESIKLWLGVTLFYDQSWWDSTEQRWTSLEGIHVLEGVNMLTRETMRRRSLPNQLELFRCSITWNTVFFKSFATGNIKYLDMNKYFSLKRPISRQMFRFLDKRFYRDRSLTFDLRTFACEHIGLSRNYDNGQIKSKLSNALKELEAAGILEPSTVSERYRKEGKIWKITLTRPPKPSDEPSAGLLADPFIPPALASDAAPKLPALASELSKRGVTVKAAADLVARHPADAIQAKIDVFDWLVEKQDKRIAKSPEGYLVKSISDDYKQPNGFISKAERQRQQEARQAKERTEAGERRLKREQEARAKAERHAINAYWESLTAEEQSELDAASIAQADAATLAMETGPMKRYGQQLRRDSYIRQLLAQRQAAEG